MAAVLNSKLFLRAPTLSRFLAYVCQKYFEGNEAALKEYSIAVEALGRRTEFDPATDSIVRVEASRLRKRLAEYYETEGAGHNVRLLLPDGSYVPQFVRPEGPLRSVPPASPALDPSVSRWSGKRAIAILSVVIALVALSLIVAGIAFPRWGRFITRSPALGSPAAEPPGLWAPPGEQVRILAGYSGPDLVDSDGHAWSSDRFVTFGRAVVLPKHRIFGTRDQALYRTAREGSFYYRIPLKPGVYEMHLHFVEVWNEDYNLESDGEDQRRFDVAVNGKPALTNFDIVKDAGGPNIADERVFKDISPGSNGVLQLNFATAGNTSALVSGIEILPGVPGMMLPVRILCGGGSHTDRKGRLWGADRYFLGGVSEEHSWRAEGDPDPVLYHGARWGRFSYSIPVAAGTYSVSLKFVEAPVGSMGRYRGTTASRVFHVLCNGEALLRNFDILKEAGSEDQPVDRVFRGLKPDASGKLTFSFVPVENYACLSAIEVMSEDR